MIFWAYASPMPGRASNWSLVAVFRSTRAALEAGDDDAWADLGAGLVPEFDCAKASDIENTRPRTTVVTIERIRFVFSGILLYCGFFSFLAA